VIGVFNILLFPDGSEKNVIDSLYGWSILAIGLCGLISAFWRSPLSRWAQILIFFLTTMLAALTSHAGELTSIVFLVFGLTLIFEYHLGRFAYWFGAVFILIPYPILLAIGLKSQSPDFATQSIVIMIGTVSMVILYGSVLLRHEFLHRQDRALLESRVKERTAELERSLAEGSVMLREIHHRVKNNLQIIISLLQLEADRQSDAALRAPIEASIQRVFVMSLVHETLYDTEEIDNIDLAKYVEQLLDASKSVSTIEIALKADGPIPVGIDFAVPFGLLLNELVSNAEKHAFPRGSNGKVDIRIESTDGILLSIADNGVGISEEVRIEGAKTLGLSLVHVLVQQLRGVISLERKSGTRWTIRLPPNKS
jgi:two-component sensor histidine kinase